MTRLDYIPEDYPLVEVVESMDDLHTRPFSPERNMFVLSRRLTGDFNALARHLGRNGWQIFDDKYVFESAARDAPEEARAAASAIYEDMNRYNTAGKICTLRVVPDTGYVFEPQIGPFREGAYGWHADVATRGLSTEGITIHHYNTPTTLHLRLEDAVRRIDAPETRARLAREFRRKGISKAQRSQAIEAEYGHWYAAKPGARPWALMPGDISRHATKGNGMGAPPHVHAAPPEEKGAAPRLLLVR